MNIALVSHDAKKDELLQLIQSNKQIFLGHKLYSTYHTGKQIKENIGLDVNTVHSGPMGGDTEIANLIVNKKIDVLIFLIDSLASQCHEYDIQALVRVANLYNTVFATNTTTANCIFNSSLFNKE